MRYFNSICYSLLAFLLLSITPISTPALILEDLLLDNNGRVIKEKRICFYPGSFDPLHLGHEKIALEAVNNNLCDFTLIYPIWQSNDDINRQKKHLTDISLRLEMLIRRFANDEKIIVTKLPPIDLQRALLDHKKHGFVIRHNIKFVGIVGSDNALTKWPKTSEQIFMHGSLIPKEHHYSSVGCIMSLPVIEFIVALRNNDDISELNGRIDGRSIIGVIDDKVTKDLSSTFVKTKLQDRVLKNTHNMLSKEVQLVIKESKLYEVIKESDKLENTVNEPDERD